MIVKLVKPAPALGWFPPHEDALSVASTLNDMMGPENIRVFIRSFLIPRLGVARGPVPISQPSKTIKMSGGMLQDDAQERVAVPDYPPKPLIKTSAPNFRKNGRDIILLDADPRIIVASRIHISVPASSEEHFWPRDIQGNAPVFLNKEDADRVCKNQNLLKISTLMIHDPDVFGVRFACLPPKMRLRLDFGRAVHNWHDVDQVAVPVLDRRAGEPAAYTFTRANIGNLAERFHDAILRRREQIADPNSKGYVDPAILFRTPAPARRRGR